VRSERLLLIMPEAILAASFAMFTLAVFSLLLPGKATYQDSSGWSHKGSSGGCASLLVGPGALLATVGIVMKELPPDYYLASLAMFGGFVAFLAPLIFVAEFGGVSALRELPARVLSAESTPGILVGRSAPRAILRLLMSTGPEAKPDSYRDGDQWGVFESQLSALASSHSRRYAALLGVCTCFALLTVPAALNQLLVVGEFDSVATAVFLVLIATTALDLFVCLRSWKQLRQAVREFPGDVAAARKAHPQNAGTQT